MSQNELSMHGATWIRALAVGTPVPGYSSTLQIVNAAFTGQLAHHIAVVLDTKGRFLRARNSKVGLAKGWQLAYVVYDVMRTDAGQEKRCAIVAIVDAVNRACGRHEEVYGTHLALAATADACAAARLAGHPVIGLIAGRAMSGALLAHDYQVNHLLALDDTDVVAHAMGKAAATRVTLRSVIDLERLAQEILPATYDIASFTSLGLLQELLKVRFADASDAGDVDTVQTALAAALAGIAANPSRDLESHLDAPLCSASSGVRKRLREQWDAQPESA